MKKPMTVEEFRAGLNDLVADIETPDSEINQAMVEGVALSNELRQFDPKLGEKVQAVFDSFIDLVAYVKARKERN